MYSGLDSYLRVPISRSVNASLSTAAESSSLRPSSLSLVNKDTCGSLQVDRARGKMTSVESIGTCSLDFDASELSEKCVRPYLTASEFTLQSSRGVTCMNGSHRQNDVLKSEEKSMKTESVQLRNGTEKVSKTERSVAEIKLPSYVSISCAINGYANYSRFCRSRDNSPARPFRKSSFEANFAYEAKPSDFQHQRISDPGVRCSRSHSDCNGNAKGVFSESRELQMSKQLQISLESPEKYTTELVINRESETNGTSAHGSTNGHVHEEFSLAKEVGIPGTKSLVQQRIESLYGVPAQEKAKFPCRTSRPNENLGSSTVKRSPSCPPQVVKSQLDTNLPVFRHLTKNFRDQLLLDDASSNSGATKIKSEAKSVTSPKDEQKPGPVTVNGAQTNGFHSLPTEVGIDECDRQAITSPNANVIMNKFKSAKVAKKEKDGIAFMDLMSVTTKEIQIDIEKWEGELQADVPEDASGKIRSACGKANLLLTQKFEQFRGLCVKNIEESEDAPFYTTCSDLAGFWDMVMLQVEDVKSNFKDLEALKANDWQEIKQPTVVPTKMRKSGAVSKSNPCTPKRTVKSAGLAQAREEARKQLLAAKKRGRQQNTNGTDSDVAIFTRDVQS